MHPMIINKVKIAVALCLWCSAQTALAQTATVTLLTQSPLLSERPNPLCTTQLCLSLKGLIDNAKSTIDFALYGYSDQAAILQALVQAKQRGVTIRGVTDKTVDGKNNYSGTPLLYQQLGNIHDDYEIDLGTQKYLKGKKYSYSKRRCGVSADRKGPVQCFEGKGYASKEPINFRGNLMHHKFFVVDQRTVWTGSANISATGTGGYNANIIALINSPKIANAYRQEFEQMFSGDYHHAKKVFKRKSIDVALAEDASLSIYFSPQSKAMRRGVIPLIRKAQKSIDVMIFFLTHNGVVKELVKAQQRGVKVRVILDATGASNAYSKHGYLREQGAAVKVESWGGKMHAKSAIIDRQHIVVGSMNWTKAGAIRNDENTIIIRNSKAQALQLTAFFDELWTSIPKRWLQADPAAESRDSGSSCFDGIDNDFDQRKDDQQATC